MTYPDAAPGQTVVLQGKLTYGAVAQGGRSLHEAGGTLLVNRHAINGQLVYRIFIYSGYGGPGSEGRLIVEGVLAHESRIFLRGGLTSSGFPGVDAQMLVNGTLHNSGEVFLYGAGLDFGYPVAGTGVTLINAGVLTSSGGIYLETGWPDNQYPDCGALLIDAGVLSHYGSIGIAGSFENSSSSDVQSATLSVTGGLTNIE